MSERTKTIALGAAAVGAGAVMVGAAIMSPKLAGNNGGNGQNPGQVNVSVAVAQIHPEIQIQSINDGDVFLSPNVTLTARFKDALFVNLELYSPNNEVCTLDQLVDHERAWESSAYTTDTQALNLSTCQGGEYGAYSVRAFAKKQAPETGYESTTKSFYLSKFGLGHVSYDSRKDPILMLSYGQGIGRADIAVACDAAEVLTMNYITEGNEDSVDEILLPFGDKNVPAGANCTATVTAKKANGDPINSQDVSGATIQTTFTYEGLAEGGR